MSKPKIIDVFAGAGGFGLGFKLAGYTLTHSIEIDKWACDTLRHNFSHTVVETDISKLKSTEAISNVVGYSPDVIVGGPPCQGFSVSGKKKYDDPRNTLYLDYLNWVKVLRPKLFVIENVQGILSFKNSRGQSIINSIDDISRKLGYKISIWKLNAIDYGVPQNRLRVFLVGDLGERSIGAPKWSHSYTGGYEKPLTVGNAISDLPVIFAGEGENKILYDKEPDNCYQKWCRAGSSAVYNHVAMKHTKRVIERYQRIIDGDTLDNLSDDLKVRMRNGNGELSKSNYNQNYRHLIFNNPSFTIPAHFYSSFVHPNLPRNITTREAARIQSFPDWYVFKGKRTMVSKKLLLSRGEASYLSQYNQVGNAVPPVLAKNIANHLINYL